MWNKSDNVRYILLCLTQNAVLNQLLILPLFNYLEIYLVGFKINNPIFPHRKN